MIYLKNVQREYADTTSIFWKQSFGGLFQASKGFTASVIQE